MRKIILAIASALVLAAASSPADAAVLVPLDPTPLDTNAQSTAGVTPASIDFVNHLNYAVDVYWINYSGNRVFYKTLGALSDYVQQTYLTHPWIIAKAGSGDTLAQGSGELIVGFLPETPDSAGLGPDIANIGGVPEPASWTLMIAGFGFVGGIMRSRRRRSATVRV